VIGADLEKLAGASTLWDPASRLEAAHATAEAVVGAARQPVDEAQTERLVSLVETVGLDTLAALWRDAEPDSLPGALWALYLLRTWCKTQGAAVARWYREGRGLAPVDEVVAGVADTADPEAMARLADAVLTGAYDGDFGVALDRAAAFFRVIAAGRLQVADAGDGPEIELAARNGRAADALRRAASAWRAGHLH
jgi:hypothetical protein